MAQLASPLSMASLAFICALSAASTVRAAEPASPARALFKEGRGLVAQGDYAAACPKFEQSLALEAGVGTQFNLADCWEHIGRTASAQALFVGAAASAKAAGQSEREEVLRDRAAALEPRIAHLVIEVADADPKLVVKRGELPLDSDAYGKAKAVDPGSYEIVAKAPGKMTWRKQVEIAAGASVVTVEVPRLEAQADEESKPVQAKKLAGPAKEPPKVVTPPPTVHPDKPVNWSAIGLGGIGVGGLVVGSVMALKYSSANSDARNICPTSRGCTSAQISEHDQKVEDARGARTWAYLGYGVGAAGLGAAAALLFLPQSTGAETGWVASPVVAGSGAFGANVSHRF